MHASKYGRGTVLELLTDSPVHATKEHGEVSDIVSVAVFNEEKEEVTIFAVNRNLEEDVALTVDVRSFEGYEAEEQIILACDDLKAENNAAGEKVFPIQKACGKIEEGYLTTVLGKASWNVIRFKKH